MLSLILATLLNVHLAEAPEHPLHGYEQEVLLMAFPVLVVINVVPGLALIRSVTKSSGTLTALYATVNVFTTLSAVVALGCLRVRAPGDFRAALEDGRSAAADTGVLLAHKEDAVAELKGALDATTEITVAELTTKGAAFEAEVIAARQDTAEARPEVENLDLMIATTAHPDFHASDAFIAEQLMATIQHLERMAADEKVNADREQDAANPARYATTEYEVMAECLEATAGMPTWELEQKDKMLEARNEQIAELLTYDSASHWEQKAAVLAAKMKTAARKDERKATVESLSTAQATSGACQTSSPSAAQPSPEELTAAGKARDTRVRSPLAREHYAQKDVVMEAKETLAATQEKIAALKKALQAQPSPDPKIKHQAAISTLPIRVKAAKENIAPSSPSQPTSSSSAASPLPRVVSSSPSSSSRLPRLSTSVKMTSQILPRSSIPSIIRPLPALTRLPR
ncbi:hypothetical protein C8T65DRAFT_739324 [Cerioporus squamosus]|nr:hypothetical protein C8T65DRAFT_739324 [Cerioporus squamosus]